MNNQDIIIIILIFAVIYLMVKTNTKEYFDVNDDIKQAINDIYKADINAIRNLSNFATEIKNNNDTFTIPANTTTMKNLTLTGNLIGDLPVTNDINIGGVIKSNKPANADGTPARVTIKGRETAVDNLQIDGNNLCINDMCIDKSLLQKLSSVSAIGGFAIVDQYTYNGGMIVPYYTYPLYEGEHNLDSYNNDKWDRLRLQRGWKIILYETGVGAGNTLTFENTDNILSQEFMIKGSPLGKKVSGYKLIWIGY